MTAEVYEYKGLKVHHLKKSRLKNIYISINRQKEITVKTNKSTPKYKVLDIVDKKASWIDKHLTKLDSLDDDIASDKAIYFMGNKYQIERYKSDRVILANKLYIPDDMEIQEAIKSFYKSNTRYIDSILQECIYVTNLQPSKVTYRYMKTRWGSCGIKNQISLNTQLLKLPKELIEYVIYHELCHILHKNHSARFWTEVAKYVPKYKECRKALRYY
jgi:predicted metal-dependent hydrolase